MKKLSLILLCQGALAALLSPIAVNAAAISHVSGTLSPSRLRPSKIKVMGPQVFGRSLPSATNPAAATIAYPTPFDTHSVSGTNSAGLTTVGWGTLQIRPTTAVSNVSQTLAYINIIDINNTTLFGLPPSAPDLASTISGATLEIHQTIGQNATDGGSLVVGQLGNRGTVILNNNQAAVPEPTSAALCLIGTLGLFSSRRRTR